MNQARVAVVTGANKGIGFATVKALCKQFNGDVILAARDVNRGNAAVEQLANEGLKVKYHQLDVIELNSIKKFKTFIQNEYGGLNILVNNAAIAYPFDSKVHSIEQAENTIRVNFIGLKDVCDEFFPLLHPHARVVNLSSMFKVSSIRNSVLKKRLSSPTLTESELLALVDEYLNDVRNGDHIKKGWPAWTYATSKVFVSALSIIQQFNFDKNRPQDDIIVNHVYPGYVNTDMTNHKGQLTPDEGAVVPTYAALLPENIKEPRGQMIWNDKTIADWLK